MGAGGLSVFLHGPCAVRQTFKRSITLRTLLVGGGLAVLLAAAFAVLLLAIQDQRTAGRAALTSQEAVTAGTELETSLVNLENGLRGYVASGRERLLEPFEQARRAYPAQVRRLTELVADEPAQQAAVMRLKREIDDYVNLWILPVLGVARDRLEVARSAISTGAGRERLDALRAGFADLFARERAAAADRERRAEDQSALAIALGIGGVGLVLLFAVGLWLYLRRAILRPVLAVADATQTVAAGDLTAHVPAEREDELGTLARAFNSMTTSLKESHDELERSNHELEQFAQVTSHDLQGPLATVAMYAALLERRVAASGDGDAAELVAGISSSTEHMRSLIRDLLHYSRVGRGGEVELVPVEGDDLLATALDNLAGPISERGAEVVAEALPSVRGDRRQLCQVFQNLIANAVKFSDEATPRVEISAHPDGQMCRFSVRDNGIGIDPAHAERIFEPFKRLHGDEHYEGTGIGLAICQRIVDHHGGRIWAESEPGAGSTFHFTVPAAWGGPAPAPPRAEPLPSVGATAS